jgi:crotonobetainyl-CoA:carnitine CoA-transferase CaiB-like acyl-CoA transferase
LLAARLGIGAEALQAINPKLVYCSISGFGQTGPMRNHAGHDLAYLAMAGSLSQSGHWREPSRRSSTPVADMAGGTYAAIAILAALQDNSGAGKAPVIDISLYESMLYMNAIRIGFEQDEPTRDHLYPTNDLFHTRDGEQIALTIIEEKFWRNFLAVIGASHPHFCSEQYATEAGRREHGDILMAQLDELILGNTADHWITLFESADVPATLCITPRQALQTEHSRARAVHVDTAQGPVLPFPGVIEGFVPHQDQHPPPTLGQDYETILTELGFKADDIERLISAGTVLPGT